MTRALLFAVVLWFGTQAGPYLYPYGGTLAKVASNPGQVAGTCR
jgi:hypothetical protein